MLNKSLLVFSFCLFSFCIKAQTVWLHKNGTLKTLQLELPKRLSIQYKSDTGIVSYKGRAYDYEFPYLFLGSEKERLVIDVRDIEELQFTNSPLGLYYGGMIITADLTIALTAASITYNYHSIHLPEFVGAMISASATFLLYKSSIKKLDTKTKWSFY